MVIAVVLGVLAYVGFLAGVIWLSVRWSRNNLKKRSDSLLSGLGSAKQVGATKAPTMYQGAETEYEVDGRRVLVNTYYQGRSYIRATLKMPGGPFPWVTLYPEGKVERFGKAIGLNREVQTGDKAFDDLVYLDTIDTEENVRRMFEPAAARAATATLLELGYKVQLSKDGVEAFQLVRSSQPIDGSRSAEAVAALGRLLDALPAMSGSGLENPRAPRRVAFAVMLIFSWVAGFVAMGASGSSVDRTVDAGASMLVFLGAGGVAWVLYVAALVAGLRGRSYALRTVLVGGFVGLVGIPAGAGALVHLLNQKLDASTATVRPLIVTQHKQLKGDCRLIVPSWRGSGTEKLFVKHKGKEELAAGTEVVVRTHPGAFGLEWIEPIAADGR